MDHRTNAVSGESRESAQAEGIGQILDDAKREVAAGRWENVSSLLRDAVVEANKRARPDVSAVPANSLAVDPARSHSLQQGFAVLAVVQQRGHGLIGVREVADAVGMSRPTTHRYMRTLLDLGHLEQDPATRKYRAL